MPPKIFEHQDGIQWARLKEELRGENVVDVAAWLEEMTNEQMIRVFRMLPKDISADVFAYMTPEQQRHIVESASREEVRAIIDDLFVDDAVDLVEELPAGVVKKILASASNETRDIINRFLRYPAQSAGSLMTIEFVDLKENMTAGDAITHIQRTGVDKETVNTCYVIDGQRRLRGSVTLRKLVLARGDAHINDLMDENPISVTTLDDQESVTDAFRKYDLLSMPVVDNESRLVGIITADDVMDVIEEENTEDFEKMAAIKPSGEEYLRTPVLKHARNRIIWLMLLMISGSLTGGIIAVFQDVLSTVVVLAASIPMLMNTGGNAGSQSATLIIRGMSLGEVEPRDILRVLWKELRISLMVGVALAIVNLVRMVLMGNQVIVSVVVSLSLSITVVIAKLVGGALPMLAKRLGVDPAIMASPMITTIVDACSLVIYFLLATSLMNIPM